MAIFWLILAASALARPADQTVPVLADCSDPTEVNATISTSAPLHVRYSLGGSAQTCYSVSTTIDGKTVQGFVLGSAHPAIAEFERQARSRIPEGTETPKPPSETDLVPPGSPSTFAGLRGVDMKGRHVELDSIHAPFVIVYFWSATNRRSIDDTDALEYIHLQYHPRGVELLGIASGPSASRVKQVSQQQEVTWPQIFDSGEIANQYHVSRERPYFILDREKNVVAALRSASDIDAAMQRLRQK